MALLSAISHWRAVHAVKSETLLGNPAPVEQHEAVPE